MVHNSRFHGNLRYVYEAMKRRDPSFRFVVVSKDKILKPADANRIVRLIKKIRGTLYFYFVLNYHFATASYLMFNDNFLPLGKMKIRTGTKVVQLWHGVGAFKKFGLTTERHPLVRKLVEEGNKKITHLFVSSKHVVPFYEEALHISKRCIYPIGVPVTDFYFDVIEQEEAKKRFYSKYPELKEKKLILYAPTFRSKKEENDQLLEAFDTEQIYQSFGQEFVTLLRLHPQIHSQQLPNDYVINVTEYEDVKDLYVVADLLVGDYSSNVVEFALLHKPILFYGYDYEQYDRGFYFDYMTMVPGRFVRTMEEVIGEIAKIQKGNYLEEQEEIANRYSRFLEFEYDQLNGKASERVVEQILKSKDV